MHQPLPENDRPTPFQALLGFACCFRPSVADDVSDDENGSRHAPPPQVMAVNLAEVRGSRHPLHIPPRPRGFDRHASAARGIRLHPQGPATTGLLRSAHGKSSSGQPDSTRSALSVAYDLLTINFRSGCRPGYTFSRCQRSQMRDFTTLNRLTTSPSISRLPLMPAHECELTWNTIRNRVSLSTMSVGEIFDRRAPVAPQRPPPIPLRRAERDRDGGYSVACYITVAARSFTIVISVAC